MMAANYFTVRMLAISLIGVLALGLLVFVPAGTDPEYAQHVRYRLVPFVW